MSINTDASRRNTILVTGAAGDIGSAVTRDLLATGRYVLATDYWTEKGNKIQDIRRAVPRRLHELMQEYPGRIEIVNCDLRSYKAYKEVCRVISSLPDSMRLDGIVSAAGIWRRYSDRLTAEHSRETDFRVNTWAPVDIARMLISKLNPDATVLNISSVSAKFRDTPGFWNYSDSKSNLLQDTRALSLHREFQEKGIRCAGLVLGYVDTHGGSMSTDYSKTMGRLLSEKYPGYRGNLTLQSTRDKILAIMLNGEGTASGEYSEITHDNSFLKVIPGTVDPIDAREYWREAKNPGQVPISETPGAILSANKLFPHSHSHRYGKIDFSGFPTFHTFHIIE